ncbi:MAG: ATP-binding protein [Nodosilinea sp.]
MIQLYGHDQSADSYKVRLQLELLGVDYQWIEVNGGDGQRPPDLALSGASPALGQVPLLIDGAIQLTDARAILLYLAQRYGETQGVSPTVLPLADVMRWLSTGMPPKSDSTGNRSCASPPGLGHLSRLPIAPANQSQAHLAEIGEMAAMIVHEVRSPFTTVYMALTSFKRMDLPPACQGRLTLALEEAERLKRLLNEILAYAREPRLAQHCLDLGDLCHDLCRSLEKIPAAQDRPIDLVVPAEPVPMRGDRDKLKQVLINLVTNALEAIAPGHTVTWRVTPTPTHIDIGIHNGGDPIPPEMLPRLTAPFVSTKPEGNGLGLAIARRLVAAHGGQLHIASSPERGTTVTVRLPRHPHLRLEEPLPPHLP